MQAPGDVVEVLAERVVQNAQQLLQSTAELKRRAFLAHAGDHLAAQQAADGVPAGLQQHLTLLRTAAVEAHQARAWPPSSCCDLHAP